METARPVGKYAPAGFFRLRRNCGMYAPVADRRQRKKAARKAAFFHIFPKTYFSITSLAPICCPSINMATL